MSTEETGGWVPLKFDGETVGRARLDDDGVIRGELGPAMAARFGEGITRGLSVAPAAGAAGCICEYENIEAARFEGPEIIRTVWHRDADCKFPHTGGRVAGGPSSSAEPTHEGWDARHFETTGCDGSLHTRNECLVDLLPTVPAVETWKDDGRNNFTFRAEPALIEAMRSLPSPLPLINSVKYRREAAEVVGVEVPALLCASNTETHPVPVPAVVVGMFEVPGVGNGQRTAYCARCAEAGEAFGWFTPDAEAGQ